MMPFWLLWRKENVRPNLSQSSVKAFTNNFDKQMLDWSGILSSHSVNIGIGKRIINFVNIHFFANAIPQINFSRDV